MFKQAEKPVRVGDKIVVGIGRWVATVEKIWFDPTTSRTQLDLDYGAHGKAKTYLHDEGSVWIRLDNCN